VSRQDGVTVKTLFALTNIADATAGVDQLAAWLLIRSEARQAMRLAARSWEALPANGETEPLGRKALVSVQAGLAAWHLKQDTAAATARRVAAGLIGKPGLPALTAAPALLKLLAMKELMT